MYVNHASIPAKAACSSHGQIRTAAQTTGEGTDPPIPVSGPQMRRPARGAIRQAALRAEAILPVERTDEKEDADAGGGVCRGGCGRGRGAASAGGRCWDNPIVFVTQVPIPPEEDDQAKVGSVSANHMGDARHTGRGGDLWLREANGGLKNLTEAAGYGNDIAVRDPTVHWNGDRVIFSMVVGSNVSKWQLYEITGLHDEAPVITRVRGQPQDYNNVSPVYGSDDTIFFTSDRPRGWDGVHRDHLYPLRNEYEYLEVVTGLWRLDRETEDVRIMAHTPSGAFTPFVDSFGRVVYTQWDHLEQDRQANIGHDGCMPAEKWYESLVTYTDESAAAEYEKDDTQSFPEPWPCRKDLIGNTPWTGHKITQFFPWQMRQNGRGMETLNHIGRQELRAYVPAGRNDDENLQDGHSDWPVRRENRNALRDIFQMREDPTEPGRYVGTRTSHRHENQGGGQIVSLERAAPYQNAEDMTVGYITHPDTAEPREDEERGGPNHSGLYRDPIVTRTGTYVAAHTAETRLDENTGTRERPRSRHDYRLKTLRRTNGGYLEAGPTLTNGIETDEPLVWWGGPALESRTEGVRRIPMGSPAARVGGPRAAAGRRGCIQDRRRLDGARPGDTGPERAQRVPRRERTGPDGGPERDAAGRRRRTAAVQTCGCPAGRKPGAATD